MQGHQTKTKQIRLSSVWSLVDVPLIFFCPADHVPDWQLRVLLGMVEARSVNVKKTTTTSAEIMNGPSGTSCTVSGFRTVVSVISILLFFHFVFIFLAFFIFCVTYQYVVRHSPKQACSRWFSRHIVVNHKTPFFGFLSFFFC